MLAKYFALEDACSPAQTKKTDSRKADIRKTDSRKADSRKADSRNADSRKADSRGKSVKKRAAPSTVEPFESGTVHARFDPPTAHDAAQSSILESEPESEAAVEDDPYEYLSQGEGEPEDETDSNCASYNSDTELFGTSPSTALVDKKAMEPALKRRAKASQPPVYSGPQLWYESDDYIE